MSAYLESDSMAPDPMARPLHLVTDDETTRLVRAADGDAMTLNEQLLFTAVLQLMKDVKRLKKQVSDLEGRETV